jgi:putative transposase
MTYSIDLRERVVAFVRGGGSKAEAVLHYRVSRKTVFNWVNASSLEPKRHGRRKRKLDWEALRQDFLMHPDLLLRERAVKFGVRVNAVFYASKQMRISHKKNTAL